MADGEFCSCVQKTRSFVHNRLSNHPDFGIIYISDYQFAKLNKNKVFHRQKTASSPGYISWL